MLKNRIAFLFLLLLIPSGLFAQNESICEHLRGNTGTDIFIKTETDALSILILPKSDNNAQLVFCPAGIERSSPNDVKRRFSFDWSVKYNNIYIENQNGIVIDGMNAHGFSASLMHLDYGVLAEKDKEHIPIAASLAVNFFIDHFKSIDTALLAVWDIRIFDDLGLDCGWPFRITLHDSTGATAYIEYIDGQRKVYTPDAPVAIVEGPSFARLLTIKYIQDSLPLNNAEKRYLELDQSLATSKFPENIKGFLDAYNKNEDIYFIQKAHNRPSYALSKASGEKIKYTYKSSEFTRGKEVRKNLFE